MDTNELAIYIRIYFILFFINFQIQNYVFLLKDVTKLHEPGAVVSETVSSEHDTGRLCEMFRLVRTNYQKVFDTCLFFRFVVSDLCWPTIHAVLEVLNNETIYEYSQRIFTYSEIADKDVDIEKQKGFLASCISHSTNRFTMGFKRNVKFSSKEQKVFAACCFSLLANSTTLEASKRIFMLMCEVFIRPNDDSKCIQARKTLQKLIEERPHDKSEIMKCINQVYPGLLDSDSDESECELSSDQELTKDGIKLNKFDFHLIFNYYLDDLNLVNWFVHDKKLTIKAASPFTRVFVKIHEDSIEDVTSDMPGEPNLLYYPQLINYFLNKSFLCLIYLYGVLWYFEKWIQIVK
jgi:hypothetical protein